MINDRPVGLLNAELVRLLVSLRHFETIVVADAGLPCPPSVPEIDLSILPGVPELAEVLEPIVRATALDGVIVAMEWMDAGHGLDELAPSLVGVGLQVVSHDQLKAMTADAKALVRTGSATPYANVILVGGVTF